MTIWAIEWHMKRPIKGYDSGELVCEPIGVPLLFATRAKATAYIKDHQQRFKSEWSIANMRRPRPMRAMVIREPATTRPQHRPR